MGFGAEVAAVVQHQAFDWLDAPIERVGAKFAPIPFAPVMEEYVVPHDGRRPRPRSGRPSARWRLRSSCRGSGRGWSPGTIVKWLKAEGDRVEKGEPLYELDTDKVTQEVEAEASGVLLKIAVAEGEVDGRHDDRRDRRAGRGGPGRGRHRAERGAAEAPRKRGRARAARAEHGPPEAGSRRRAAAGARRHAGGRVKASPLARRIARERGIDLASLRGTGPEGRIVAEDVERAAAAPAAQRPARGARADRRGRASCS